MVYAEENYGGEQFLINGPGIVTQFYGFSGKPIRSIQKLGKFRPSRPSTAQHTGHTHSCRDVLIGCFHEIPLIIKVMTLTMFAMFSCSGG